MNSLKQNEMTQCDSCFEHYQCGKKQDHKGNHIWAFPYDERMGDGRWQSLQKIEWRDQILWTGDHE